MTLLKHQNLCCQRECPGHVLASPQLSHLINYPSSVPISFSQHSLCPSPGLQRSSLISWGCGDSPHVPVYLCLLYYFFRREPVIANPRLGLGIGAMRSNSCALTLANICGYKGVRGREEFRMRRNRRRRRSGRRRCKMRMRIVVCCLLLTFFWLPYSFTLNMSFRLFPNDKRSQTKKTYSKINKWRWGSSVDIETAYGLSSRGSIP